MSAKEDVTRTTERMSSMWTSVYPGAPSHNCRATTPSKLLHAPALSYTLPLPTLLLNLLFPISYFPFSSSSHLPLACSLPLSISFALSLSLSPFFFIPFSLDLSTQKPRGPHVLLKSYTLEPLLAIHVSMNKYYERTCCKMVI